MDNGAATAELSADETAYFESGGETALPDTPQLPDGDSGLPPADGQQPSANADGQPDGQQGERGRFVPHQALHAEREEHKKTKSELEQIRQQQAVLNDRWNTLLALRQSQEQPPEVEQPPDPDQDIFAFAKWQAKQLEQLQTTIADQQKQTDQQRQIEAQEREIWSSWQQDAQAYATEAPEFGDAVKWLSDFRSKQLQAFAPIDDRFASPEGITNQINAELRSIIISAKQKGINPAQVVHQVAQAYGFAPAAPDPANLTLPESLAKVAAAQDASKTIGAIPGGAGGDALTPQAIAAMSAAEFDRWASDPKNASLLDKMLGA